MSYLIIASVDSDTTKTQRDTVTEVLRTSGYDVWHHLEYLWLIFIPDQTTLPSEPGDIRKAIRPHTGTANVLTIRTESSPLGMSWYLPKSANLWLTDRLKFTLTTQPF